MRFTLLFQRPQGSVLQGSSCSALDSELELCLMSNHFRIIVGLFLLCAPTAFAGVIVSSPANGAAVQGPVPYRASATAPSCSKGVGSMGIYTAPGVLAYVVDGASLNTELNLNPGTYNTVVEEWDNCGGAATTPVTITVSGQSGVQVSSPANHSTVSSPVSFVSSSATSCSKGIGSMGIYTAPGVLAYVVNGASLNTNLTLNPGTYNTVVEEWDNCGGAATTPVTITVSAQSAVLVTSPPNNGILSSPVNFVGTATTTCAKGVASMGIYPAPGQLAYVSPGASLNSNLQLSPGKYNVVIEEWDNCGGAATTPVSITVENGFANLQQSVGWAAAGQGPPDFVDCNPCGPQITWSMAQGIKTPSLSGSSTQFKIGGTGPYWDVLFNNHLIGDESSQGLLDQNHAIVPSVHNLTYDVYFYGGNLGASQALEFDINQFFDGMGFIWGHECRIAGGNGWDIWDNVNAHWVQTGVPCYPNNNAWNHLTIQVQRTSNNQLLYQSITLNGVTNVLNSTYSPGSAPGWYGITVNYQLDGNNVQSPYSVYLDKLTFLYQ
jgi:major membrane immunogen (membrane-anchored lipoprotein)